MASVERWPPGREPVACTGRGLVGSVVLIVLGPAVWVKILGHAAPVFPSDDPTLVTAPLAFAVAILTSRARRARPLTAA